MSWRSERKACELRAKQAEEQVAKFDQLEAERKKSQAAIDKMKAQYQGAESTKPSLEDIYYQVSNQYGYSGRGNFVADLLGHADRPNKLRQFESVKKYPQEYGYEGYQYGKYGVGFQLVEDHTPPEPIEPVPQGKTLDELFAEDGDE